MRYQRMRFPGLQSILLTGAFVFMAQGLKAAEFTEYRSLQEIADPEGNAPDGIYEFDVVLEDVKHTYRFLQWPNIPTALLEKVEDSFVPTGRFSDPSTGRYSEVNRFFKEWDRTAFNTLWLTHSGYRYHGFRFYLSKDHEAAGGGAGMYDMWQSPFWLTRGYFAKFRHQPIEISGQTETYRGELTDDVVEGFTNFFTEEMLYDVITADFGPWVGTPVWNIEVTLRPIPPYYDGQVEAWYASVNITSPVESKNLSLQGFQNYALLDADFKTIRQGHSTVIRGFAIGGAIGPSFSPEHLTPLEVIRGENGALDLKFGFISKIDPNKVQIVESSLVLQP